MPINWTDNLNTGIDVIDQQHRRIVDFINHLEIAQGTKDLAAIKLVVDDCVDYTQSHFTFEESLQEEAGYVYCKPHKKVHQLFIRRLAEYQERLNLGDNVGEELHQLLSRWLINHIKHDDADYVSAVKATMIEVIEEKEKKKESRGWLARFFK